MWFPIWDIGFGTAVAPRPGECPRTGVAGVSVQTLGQAYLQPLVGWRRMMLERLSSRTRGVVPTKTRLR